MAKPTYFNERKEFLARMVENIPKGSWQREMGFTKKIFNDWPVDFLLAVKPPFSPMNSLAYFVGEEERKYLDIELKRFNFKPESITIRVEKEKVGEDAILVNKQSIRSFLTDE